MIDPNNAELLKELVQALEDNKPDAEIDLKIEEYEKKLRSALADQITDPKEVRIMILLSAFALRKTIREMYLDIVKLKKDMEDLDYRVKEKLKAMRRM